MKNTSIRPCLLFPIANIHLDGDTKRDLMTETGLPEDTLVSLIGSCRPHADSLYLDWIFQVVGKKDAIVIHKHEGADTVDYVSGYFTPDHGKYPVTLELAVDIPVAYATIGEPIDEFSEIVDSYLELSGSEFKYPACKGDFMIFNNELLFK